MGMLQYLGPKLSKLKFALSRKLLLFESGIWSRRASGVVSASTGICVRSSIILCPIQRPSRHNRNEYSIRNSLHHGGRRRPIRPPSLRDTAMILYQERGNCSYFNMCWCLILSTARSSSASPELSSRGWPRYDNDHRQQYGLELRDCEETTAEQSPPEACNRP
jgi:hypothetical protein